MAVRIHFTSKKYDITNSKLPRKQQFLNQWNDGRKDRDGMCFYRVMEKIPADNKKYIRCFAAYRMKNESYHVSEILLDNFATYYQNELELTDILNTVKSDYLTAVLHASDNNIDLQKMFYGTVHIFPLIYRLFDRGMISVNSMIAFHDIFGIGNLRGGIQEDIVLMERAKRYRLIFDKYSPIVYNEFFKHIAWKKEIQAYHREINKI